MLSSCLALVWIQENDMIIITISYINIRYKDTQTRSVKQQNKQLLKCLDLKA